jgi:parallel beta-helix repeat protein
MKKYLLKKSTVFVIVIMMFSICSYAQFVIINYKNGDDLGAKINAADIGLGDNPGTIVVQAGITYIIKTPITLSKNHNLYLKGGEYMPTTDVVGPVILLKGQNMIYGDGNTTIVYESPDTNQISHAIIESWDDFHALQHDAGNYGDFVIKEIHFKGVKRLKRTFDSAVPTVGLGNAINARVEHCYFDSTTSIAVVAGAYSVGPKNEIFHAENIWIVNNQFLHVASQNIGIVNAKNFHIEGNTFNAAGQVRGQEISSGASTYIDIEPNAPTDVAENFTISNNIIDARPAGNLGNGIIVQQGGSSVLSGPGVIGNNTIIGGGYPPESITNALSIAILLAGCRDVIVTGNTVRRCGQQGLYLAVSIRCFITGNRLHQVGGGGIHAVSVDSSTYCVFQGNSIFSADDNKEHAGSNENIIMEGYSSDYNYYFDNYFDQLNQNYTAADMISLNYDPKIILIGRNSREFNNNFRGSKVGQGNIRNIAELRLFPVPYLRAGRQTVKVDGMSQPGDGLGGSFYWEETPVNPTDDGINIIKPGIIPDSVFYIQTDTLVETKGDQVISKTAIIPHDTIPYYYFNLLRRSHDTTWYYIYTTLHVPFNGRWIRYDRDDPPLNKSQTVVWDIPQPEAINPSMGNIATRSVITNVTKWAIKTELAYNGQFLTIIFQNNTGAKKISGQAEDIKLSSKNPLLKGNDRTTLVLQFDGKYWIEITRSLNDLFLHRH